MLEMLKGWVSYLTSVLIGSVGFLEKCDQFLDLVFVTLGIVGLILSIKLTLVKLKKSK